MRLLDIEHFDVYSGGVPLLIERPSPIDRQPGAGGTPYAILSHRWQRTEVTFHDLRSPEVQNHPGYTKLINAIFKAQEDGHKHLWIDACCINKDSSAELSEAINSMYRWYQAATVCYAYLQDVETIDNLKDSIWFTRGWTLQEMLAPTNVRFYTRDWQYLGDKMILSATISALTNIPRRVLEGKSRVVSHSVAARMSWASRRSTERVEDVAYSLMGLFSVNMPLLYGEGAKAFTRLQVAIMDAEDDYTLFAWRKPSPILSNEHHGLLADAPSDFAGCGTFVAYHDWKNSTPARMTNKGIKIELGVQKSNEASFLPQFTATLPCTRSQNELGFITIDVVGVENSPNSYLRKNPHMLHQQDNLGQAKMLYFPQAIPQYSSTSRAQHSTICTIYCTQETLKHFEPVTLFANQAHRSLRPRETPVMYRTEDEGASHCYFRTVLPRWNDGLSSIVVFKHVAANDDNKHNFVLVGIGPERRDGTDCFALSVRSDLYEQDMANSKSFGRIDSSDDEYSWPVSDLRFTYTGSGFNRLLWQKDADGDPRTGSRYKGRIYTQASLKRLSPITVKGSGPLVDRYDLDLKPMSS